MRWKSAQRQPPSQRRVRRGQNDYRRRSHVYSLDPRHRHGISPRLANLAAASLCPPPHTARYDTGLETASSDAEGKKNKRFPQSSPAGYSPTHTPKRDGQFQQLGNSWSTANAHATTRVLHDAYAPYLGTDIVRVEADLREQKEDETL